MGNLRFTAMVGAAALCGTLSVGAARAQDCSDLYNPNQVLTFNITMSPADWETLRTSCPNGKCPPAPHTYYQATLECGSIGPILVGIRRKSDLAEPSETDPQKVSLKLDINEFIPGQEFAGKTKLSLENGSEGKLISEGLSWQMYQASGGFICGRCAWVDVYVNGDHKGLYSNVEQVDKMFLTDNGLDNDGWLFKQTDQRTRENPLELNAFAFNWYPFDHMDTLVYPVTPTPPDWRDQVLWRVNMPGLLSLGAVENFTANVDAVVNKMTNYFYYDWSILPGDDPAGQQQRLYFPWDMDTSMRSQDVNLSIFDSGPGHLEQGLIEELDELGEPYAAPTFRADYFTIYKARLNGPLALSQTMALIDGLEPIIGPHLDADPYTQTGGAGAAFGQVRQFIQGRTNSIVAQMSVLGEGHSLQTPVVGNGTVFRDPDKPTIYDAGEVVELTAVPDPGSHFVTWSNGVKSNNNPLLLTMDAPKSVAAFFAQAGETVEVYDFTAGGGLAHFAYGTYTDSWAQDLEGTRRKCPEVCTEVTAVSANAYSRLAQSDAIGGDSDPNRYINPDEASQDESTLIVEFNITEDPADVLGIHAMWEGYGDRRHHIELYIWNYAQGNWGDGAGSFGENNFMDDGSGDADFTLSGSVTSNVSEYVSPAGQITLLIYDDAHSEDSFHDFVRVAVIAVAGECTVDGDCDDGVACTDDACVSGACVFTTNDGNCDDGLFCNGAETCDALADCLPGGNPCQPSETCNEITDTCDQCQVDADCDDGVGCTDDTCVAGACVFTTNDGNCDDGLFCNGAETCDALADCVPGGDPCQPSEICNETTDTCVLCQVDADCDDGVGCTDDACVAGTCVFTTNDGNCDDGLFCNGAETCDALADCVPGGDPCQPSEICNETTDTCVLCQVDADCDDGVGCTDDACVAGACAFTPNAGNCDDGLYCNGSETCDAALDCQAGTPPDCDDGVACTDDWCDEIGDTCLNSAEDSNCDDGLWCNGAETCDALADCLAGADPCPGQSCDEVGDQCVTQTCNDNGVCEAGEDCNNCPSDCFTGSGPGCGNGVCETSLGEDCVSCPQDCNGKQDGNPNSRYCCGDGDGISPVGCEDGRCTADGNTCSDLPVSPSCCGDGYCEGTEDSYNCEIDCGAPSYCDDGTCDPDEDACNCPQDCGTPPLIELDCADGLDDDCDSATDCADTDCAADPACDCLPRGDPCSADGECCSNKCRGGTCK